MIADLLRAQHDSRVVVSEIPAELSHPGGAQRQRRRGRHREPALSQQVQHAVLNDLGVGGEIVERPVLQAGEHGVRYIAHARLQGQ